VAGCGLGNVRGGPTPALPASTGWQAVPAVTLVPQASRTDCGAAALTMVLAHWRSGTTLDAVRAELGPVDDEAGVQAARLRALARSKGLQAYVIEARFEDLVREVSARRPVIVGVVNVKRGRAYPHYEVVVGVNPRTGRVLTADPATGWRDQPLAELDDRWRLSKHLALVVLP
jgi:ABC-type bacteriocin/lantibiotic exporter with double-glycine peptidase domain